MKKVLSLLLASTFALALLCVANVKAEGEETVEETVSLTVHYQKFTAAYEGAAFYGWPGGIGTPSDTVYGFTGVDDFGAFRTVELPTATAHATSGNSELIVFHSGVNYFEKGETEGGTNWGVLDNVKSQGGNVKFDGTKFGQAWETGEVHLWYYEGMTLANGCNVAVSDGSEESKAAAKKEAVAYHEVTGEDGKVTAYGYGREGYKTLRFIVAFADKTEFYNKKTEVVDEEEVVTYIPEFELYTWGSEFAKSCKDGNCTPLVMTTKATYNGSNGTYGIFYGWVKNEYASGAGFIVRTVDAWAKQTADIKEETVPGFDQAIADAPANSVIDLALLFEHKGIDLRIGTEAVAAWVVEVNSLRVTEAYFDGPEVVYVTVSKDVPVTEALTTDRFVVKTGEETVAIEAIRYDAASALVTKFRLELATAIDPSKEYKVFVNFTIDGVLYENDKAIECDTTAPVIECSDKVTANICSGAFALPTIVVTDTKDGSIKQWYFKTGEGYNTTVDTGKVGEYKITVGAKDKMGNEGLKEIIVEVVDKNASKSNANAGLALLGLLPTAVIGLVAFRKYAM